MSSLVVDVSDLLPAPAAATHVSAATAITADAAAPTTAVTAGLGTAVQAAAPAPAAPAIVVPGCMWMLRTWWNIGVGDAVVTAVTATAETAPATAETAGYISNIEASSIGTPTMLFPLVTRLLFAPPPRHSYWCYWR